MRIVGIVCEYNPFHSGHEYHIRRSRELAGEDSAVVCVMSGDFVQRGEAACMTKYARAETAVKCGADLVIELPLPWSVASAEGFAEAAVYLLNAVGADYISFGAECGNVDKLTDIAQCVLSDGFQDTVRELMLYDRTLPYAAARESVLQGRLGANAAFAASPNNILGIEYIKAIIRNGYDITPVAVTRQGNGHDEKGEGGYVSSTSLREMMNRGEDISECVPEEVSDIICREKQLGRIRTASERYDTAMMSRLRMLPVESFRNVPDGEAGAGERLYNAVHEEATLEDAVTAATTKRYAKSRMRRMMVCAALGITKELASTLPPYIRILAANTAGCGIIRKINDRTVLPVLTKPADVRQHTDSAETIFTLGSDAHDMFVLTFPAKKERKGYKDWKTSPIIVKNA